MMRNCFFLAALASLGCSKGTVGGNPFDVSDSMVPMEDASGDSAEDSGDESASTSSGGPISASFSSGNDSTTGDPASSGDATTEAVSVSDSSSSSSSSTTDAPADSSSSGDPPTGGQPAMGMYAHCYDGFFDNCDAGQICVNITDQMEGYCTSDGCSNPALDCDDAPGGTAQPFCFSAGGYSLCGLDCSGGESCATGMVCQAVSFDGITNFSLCM